MRRTTLLILLCCLLAERCDASHRHLLQQRSTLSGKAIVIEYDREGSHTRLLAVHTPAGKHVLVHGCSHEQLETIQTGMDIEVSGEWEQAPAGGRRLASASNAFKATTVRLGKPAFAAPAVTTSGSLAAGMTVSASAVAPAVTRSTNKLVKKDLSTIFVPIAGVDATGAACPGVTLPKFTAADVKGAVFAESNPTGTTVGSTYSKCSMGKTKLTVANSKVADLVKLPCAGTTNEVAWTFSKCDFDDFNGYADAADEVLKARGINMTNYEHRVYLVPPGTCPFVGLGYVGCDGSYICRAWINGDFWTTPETMTHELGHNLYLAHAGALNSAGVYDEYADSSGIMGYCCYDRCPNTPHAWQLGWLSVQQLDGTTVQAGQTVRATLASQSVSLNSGMRIVPTWTTGQDPLFIGYRTLAGGDAAMLDTDAGRVHLYTAAITNTYNAAPTTWKKSLSAAGQSWQLPAAGLVVRLHGLTSTAATVSVCRKGGAETADSCAAGVDKDCNGLAGDKDPACFKFASLLDKPSPPKPKPRPPPPKPKPRPPPPKPAPRPPLRRPPPKMMRRPRRG
ncbi:hypothetical protein ACK3TF_002516 [Chlorella vulgaris]